jgi:hypothetical protein
VQSLEARRSAGNNNNQIPANNSPFKSIIMFASKLLPSVDQRKRLQSMFNIVYDNMTSFCHHVNTWVKGSIMDTVLLSCHKETKNHFTKVKVIETLGLLCANLESG